MKTITMLNEKGGVGKTTLATHLASGLAALGHRVLLIDADPQGHSTIRSRIAKAPGLYDLLVRGASWKDVVAGVKPQHYSFVGDTLPSDKNKTNLYVLPSNVETRNIANSISDVQLLSERLDEIRGGFDFCIMDTSPTPSLLHGTMYFASDAMIYPTKLSFTASDGLRESIRRRESANIARSTRWGIEPIELLGVIPLDYRPNTIEQRREMELLVQNFGERVWEPIPQSIIWQESESQGLPVWSIDPNHRAVQQIMSIVYAVESLQKVTYGN